jgi:uncharacterized protein
MTSLVRLLRRFTVDQWRLIDEQCREELQREQEQEAASPQAVEQGRKQRGKGRRKAPAIANMARKPAYEWRLVVVLMVVAVSLSLQEYYGERAYFQKLFPHDQADPYWTLKSFAWWSGWRLFGYVLLPMMAIALMPGERIRDYYIGFKGFVRHLWIYVALFLIVFPAVIIVAQTESFQRVYPFYKLSNRSIEDFLMWEAMYAVQFLSLEFFFRGFMLRGLRSIGSKAIFVMAVPYCMIHFGKPFSETMGAIIAGIVLGTLAMRTRSIWGGVLIHVGVAVSMDLLALQHCPPADSGAPCKGR